MPQTWECRVKSSAGALRAVLTGGQDGYTSFSYTRRVNSPGAYGLLFMRRANESLAAFQERVSVFELDGQIEFRWKWPEQEIDWHTDGEFLHRDGTYYVTVEGGLVYESAGRGYVDLVNRRIIEAIPGSAGAVKEGAAETIIKEYVDEQAGPGAGARAIPGLSVEADGATGNDTRWPKAYRNLIDTIQEISEIGGGDFDVVGTGGGLYEFRWYLGQRGTDRSTTQIFSLDRDNITQPTLALKHHDEVNAILVGGQGEGADRELVWRTDAARIAASSTNRIERWRDARQEDDLDGLNALGDEWLREGEPKEILDFIPLQVPGSLLGRHYFFGDLVQGQFMGHSAIKQVAGYTYTWNERQHDVKVILRDVI